MHSFFSGEKSLEQIYKACQKVVSTYVVYTSKVTRGLITKLFLLRFLTVVTQGTLGVCSSEKQKQLISLFSFRCPVLKVLVK